MTLLRLASSVFLLVVLLKGVPAWRRHRRKFVFQEFGYETERFSLADDGELRYAQWLHPMEGKKTLPVLIRTKHASFRCPMQPLRRRQLYLPLQRRVVLQWRVSVDHPGPKSSS